MLLRKKISNSHIKLSSPDYLCVFEQAKETGQDLILQMGKLVFS